MMRWNLHPIDSFDQFAREWDRLNATHRAVPFLESSFVANALQYFGTGKEVLATGTDNTSTGAIAVLTRKGRGAWETFQPSQLPLGAWINHPGVRLESVLGTLVRELPGVALVLGITQQDPYLAARPETAGCLRTLDYIQTAWVEVSGTFTDYWAARGKNLRQNMKRQRARLGTEQIHTRLEVIRDPSGVADAIRDYGLLESAGWKAGSGTAVHLDNAQGRFYRAVLENFCGRGAGCIYRYRFNEQVVAVDLCVESHETQVVVKTTYDESIRAFSPSSLMRQEVFEQLFSEGRIKRIEFYGKLMDWHMRWTDKVRTLYHVNWYRWPLLERIHSLRKGPGASTQSPAEHAN